MVISKVCSGPISSSILMVIESCASSIND
jgi:hypothetical protein